MNARGMTGHVSVRLSMISLNQLTVPRIILDLFTVHCRTCVSPISGQGEDNYRHYKHSMSRILCMKIDHLKIKQNSTKSDALFRNILLKQTKKLDMR